MEVIIAKAGNGYFRILHTEDFDKINALRIGEEVKAKLTRPRNLAFHRKFFALLNIVAENIPEHLEKDYPTVEQILIQLKIELGYFDEYRTTSGRVAVVPQSISFAAMDDLQFREFYDRAVSACCRVFLPGADKDAVTDYIFSNF